MRAEVEITLQVDAVYNIWVGEYICLSHPRVRIVPNEAMRVYGLL